MTWLDSYLHRAVVEAVLVGAIGGAVGVHIVLRRLAFFTVAMTHATFPGVVLAALVGANLFLGSGAFGILVVLAVAALSRIRGHDLTAATGIALSAGFALGVVLLSAQAGFTKDLTAYTVGDILTVTPADLATTTAIGVVILVILVALAKELHFAAFDPAGFAAAGYPALVVDIVLLTLIEAAAVTAVPAVGTVLAVALLIAPAATARLWTHRMGLMMALAVVLGAVTGMAGILASLHLGVAAGGAIVLGNGLVFVVSFLAAPVVQRLRARSAGGGASPPAPAVPLPADPPDRGTAVMDNQCAPPGPGSGSLRHVPRVSALSPSWRTPLRAAGAPEAC